MPNVWLPVEVLVVTAKICASGPETPRQAMEPSPQPVLSIACASAATKVRTAAASI